MKKLVNKGLVLIGTTKQGSQLTEEGKEVVKRFGDV